MKQSDDKSEARWLWGLVSLSLGLMWLRLASFSFQRPDFFFDDAYIYLRYARNTVQGCFLRFNCGSPPVEGFSSPAFLALLTLGRWGTTHDLVLLQVLTTFFNGLALSGAVLLCLHPLVHRGNRLVGVSMAMGVTAIFLWDELSFVHAVLGLETPMAAVCPLLLFSSALDRRLPWMRTLVLASTLVRPEFGVFVPLLAMLRSVRDWRYWLPLLAALLLVALIRLAVFGDVVPNTYWAKSGGTWDHVLAGLDYLKAGALDYPVIVLAPLALLWRQGRHAVGFVLAAMGGFSAFQLRTGGDFFPFSRWFFFWSPLATTLFVVGLAEVLRRLQGLLRPQRREPELRGRLAALVLGACALVGPVNGGRHQVAQVRPMLSQKWESLGRWFEVTPEGTRIAVTMIGAVGYYSQKHIIDLVGLVHPEIAKHNRGAPMGDAKAIAHERHNTSFVLYQRPDFFVFMQNQDHPWRPGDSLRVANEAERRFFDAVDSGVAPYRLFVPEIRPGLYWVMMRRVGTTAPAGP